MAIPSCEICGGSHPTEIHKELAGEKKEQGPIITTPEERRERIEALTARVDELFPGPEAESLRKDITERSFLVPQWGEFHNEGMMMDSHLRLIKKKIDEAREGTFPEEVPEHARETIQLTLERIGDDVERYLFLHDISKADCMTLKYGEEVKAVTWDEWTRMLEGSEDGRAALEGDEAALVRFLQADGITGISYYQERDGEKVSHGDEGAERIRKYGVDMDPVMLTAIQAHEVAFSFDEINLSTYEKYFGSMADDERDFAFTASYSDAMGQMRRDRTTDLTNFLFLAASKEKAENYRALLEQIAGETADRSEINDAMNALFRREDATDKLFVDLMKKISDGRFEGGKLAKILSKLRSAKDPFPTDVMEQTLQDIRENVKLPSYSPDKLRVGLQQLVDSGDMDPAAVEEIVSIMTADPTQQGRAFGKVPGPKRGLLRNILEEAKE